MGLDDVSRQTLVDPRRLLRRLLRLGRQHFDPFVRYVGRTRSSLTLLSRDYVVMRTRTQFRRHQKATEYAKIQAYTKEGKQGVRVLTSAIRGSHKGNVFLMDFAFGRRGKLRHTFLNNEIASLQVEDEEDTVDATALFKAYRQYKPTGAVKAKAFASPTPAYLIDYFTERSYGCFYDVAQPKALAGRTRRSREHRGGCTWISSSRPALWTCPTMARQSSGKRPLCCLRSIRPTARASPRTRSTPATRRTSPRPRERRPARRRNVV